MTTPPVACVRQWEPHTWVVFHQGRTVCWFPTRAEARRFAAQINQASQGR